MDANRPLSEADLVAVAQVSSSLSRLNAVPNADWSTPAARIFGQAADAVAVITVADFDDHGVITDLHSVGAAAPNTVRHDQLAEFVHTKRELSSLSWWIKTSTATVAILNDLESNRTWASSRAGKEWSRLGVRHLVVAVGKVPGAIDSRYAVVEIGYSGAGSEPGEADASRVRALFPVLASRVSLAFNRSDTRDTMVTVRELEVLEHLAIGRSVKQIAEELDRSEHTIHDHVKSLHRKLGATSRGELIGRALGHVASMPPMMDQTAAKAGLGAEIRVKRTSAPAIKF